MPYDEVITGKTSDEIKEIMKDSFEGEVPDGYHLYVIAYVSEDDGMFSFFKKLVMNDDYAKKIIEERIVELRLKLIAGTITPEEREELKLLIG